MTLLIKTFLFSLFTLSFTCAQAATFDIKNNCRDTVWAAAVPGGGRQLNSGKTWTINVAAGTKEARIWARTGCNFDGSGHGHCQTGDCGGLLNCQAYVDGFNVPMDFSPTSNGCTRDIQCTADVNGQCPSQLKAQGGCNNPCTVFKTDNYCCNISGNCGPTAYSKYFKGKCPDAFSYPKDDATSIFTCKGGTNYKVVFCP
ncbi:hypothetical protein P8452_34586 [Trifolium repens]|nr:hypothetical protein P8452_34586 [Trifolium repens]